MPHRIDQLRLELVFPEPGHRTPRIALLAEDGADLGRIPTSEPAPCLPLDDASVRSVDARDVLEHVHDEQTWLAELARILAPGGEIVVRVPLENAMAWADALNIYRYVSDISGRGEDLLETLPTGWHRHYAPGDLPAILELAGFETVSTTTEGLPIEELPHLGGLIVGKIILGRNGVERRLFRARRGFRDRPRLPMPKSLAATMTVRATKTEPAYRPDPDLDPENRPEQDATRTLE